MVPAFDFATELLRHRLLAVADAEDRHARRIDRGRSERRIAIEHRGRTAGQDHALRPHRPEGLVRPLKRHDFAVHFLFAHTSGDELGDLRAKIDNQNLVVRGQPVRIGIGHERGIEDAHLDLCAGRGGSGQGRCFITAGPATLAKLVHIVG